MRLDEAVTNVARDVREDHCNRCNGPRNNQIGHIMYLFQVILFLFLFVLLEFSTYVDKIPAKLW